MSVHPFLRIGFVGCPSLSNHISHMSKCSFLSLSFSTNIIVILIHFSQTLSTFGISQALAIKHSLELSDVFLVLRT